MKAHPIHLVISHSVNTLPDSLRDRKALLAALIEIIPTRHALRDRVHLLLTQLEVHEANQLSLALDFKSQQKESSK